MTSGVAFWLACLLWAMAGSGTLYLIASALLVARFVRRRAASGATPPVSILKPLYGAEPSLYENLRSFCMQDYPAFQVVFGVQRADDPAIAVVRRLQADLPQADLALVIDTTVHGTNLKVGNLTNMMAAARHDILVVADSDMRAEPHYLRSIVPPLADGSAGLVTCAYTGRSSGGFWSALGVLFINMGFLPQVVLGHALGGEPGCFGATMALRRRTLDALGGWAALKDHLADDHALGAAVRAQGLPIHLSHHLVVTQVDEPDLSRLLQHELRWARTIKLLAPAGFAGSVVTHPVALSFLALLPAGYSGFLDTGLVVMAATLTIRLGMAALLRHFTATDSRFLWLVPIRDVLSFGVFVAAFCGSRVAWRGRHFRIDGGGKLVIDGRRPAP